jgi:8-oxo-dGTP pyrophosphatase MutT (NUDIX family)
MKIEKFNIRVYGILLNENNEVLVVDEEEYGMRFTKFPGGGLEFGEGLHDGLKREWMEELHTKIDVTKHIYTTDFFQASAFNPKQQLISIYYEVKLLEPLQLRLSEQPFSFNDNSEEKLCFRWVPFDTFLIEQLTFPIDKLVVQNILK